MTKLGIVVKEIAHNVSQGLLSELHEMVDHCAQFMHHTICSTLQRVCHDNPAGKVDDGADSCLQT